LATSERTVSETKPSRRRIETFDLTRAHVSGVIDI
jgi:hypothetical protein